MNKYVFFVLLAACINIPFMVQGSLVNWLSFAFCLGVASQCWEKKNSRY